MKYRLDHEYRYLEKRLVKPKKLDYPTYLTKPAPDKRRNVLAGLEST